MPLRAARTCESILREYVWPVTGSTAVESHLAGHEAVECLDLGVISLEELQKAGLRSGRSFHAAKSQLVETVLNLLQVENQVVTPQRGPLADRRRLGRLQMGVRQACQIAVFRGEIGQGVDDGHQSIAERMQALAKENQVGVIGDVTTRRPQVDDPRADGQ